MSTRSDWILVGVDGGAAGEAAVRYASWYAAGQGLRLRLLHVAPETTCVVGADEEQASTGWVAHRRLLDQAVADALELLDATDPDRVVADVAFGGRVDQMLRASRDCHLVVLGDQRRADVDRLATGSVLAGVAARCAVPVIGVPAGWTPSGTDPVVVAGVKSAAESDVLLEYASQVASARRGRLVVLHARDASHGAPGHQGTREVAARSALAGLVADHGSEGDVRVDIDVRCGRPAPVIVDASAHADLVVLTRRSLVHPQGHLGGTGRAVLRASRCPVAVVPPAAVGSRVPE